MSRLYAARDEPVVQLKESFGICKRANQKSSPCPNKTKQVILGSGYCMECYDRLTENKIFKGVQHVL